MTPRTPTTAAGRALLDEYLGGRERSPFVDDILAIESEARAEVTDDMTTAYMVGFENGKDEARAPLDVERLAHALHMLHVPGWFNGHRSSDLDLAADIAREYAALEEPTPQLLRDGPYDDWSKPEEPTP
jgi:hypothetical protein